MASYITGYHLPGKSAKLNDVLRYNLCGFPEGGGNEFKSFQQDAC